MSGSGRSTIAGVGFDFRLSERTTLALFARGVRSRMDALSSNNPGDPERQPERTIVSVGAALSLYP
jgi:hypothetical protein